MEKTADVKKHKNQANGFLLCQNLDDELLNEKKKLETILEFSNDEIILTDKSFHILSTNKKVLDEKIIKENNLYKTLIPFLDKEDIAELETFITTNSNCISLFLRINEKFIKANISKMNDEKGLDGFLCVINDNTKEVELKYQRDRFIETLTHDLKTPVRAEKRAIELMLDGTFGKLNKEQEEMLLEILNSSKYMLRMTDNILTKYKIDNGQCELKITENIIKLTINNCISHIKHLLSAKEQTLKVVTNLKDEIFAYDEVEISRVIFNLLANATEYSAANTKIILGIKQKEHELEIFVQDQGIGIPEEKIKHIFDEYETSAKRFKKVGSGLGLFVTKKIVEAHGGKIIVESKIEKGSKFTFTIPISKNSNIDIVH